MSEERILFPEFRDELETTRYPFGDAASLTADTAHVLEPDTFLDASLYPIGADYGLYISQIVVTTRSVTIILSDSGRVARASAVFSPLAPPDLLRFTDAYGRPAGVLVSESLRLSRFSSWDVGTHTFLPAATQFVAAVVMPTPEAGLRGLLTEKNELLTGDVWLLGDNGIMLREEDGHIRIDVVGDPLFIRKLCDPLARFEAPNFIRTINGCPPNLYGDFQLAVGDHLQEETIVRIYPDNDGLVIAAIGKTNTVRGT